MCVNREEVGKRKGGFTCVVPLSERENGYRCRRCVGGARGAAETLSEELTYTRSSEEPSLYMLCAARIWQMKHMMQY